AIKAVRRRRPGPNNPAITLYTFLADARGFASCGWNARRWLDVTRGGALWVLHLDRPDHSSIGGCQGTSTSSSGISTFTRALVSSTSVRSSSAADAGSALATRSRRSERLSGLS